MTTKRAFFILQIFLSLSLLSAQNTIILQQGRNGYTGCEDTYFHFHSNDTSTQDVNHGSDTDLFIKDCYG